MEKQTFWIPKEETETMPETEQLCPFCGVAKLLESKFEKGEKWCPNCKSNWKWSKFPKKEGDFAPQPTSQLPKEETIGLKEAIQIGVDKRLIEIFGKIQDFLMESD